MFIYRSFPKIPGIAIAALDCLAALEIYQLMAGSMLVLGNLPPHARVYVSLGMAIVIGCNSAVCIPESVKGKVEEKPFLGGVKRRHDTGINLVFSSTNHPNDLPVKSQ